MTNRVTSVTIIAGGDPPATWGGRKLEHQFDSGAPTYNLKERIKMRVPMITRTIQTTTAKVMCLDVTSGSTTIQEFKLPRTYKDSKAILKALADKNTDTMKLVHVVDSTVTGQLYGMPESKFMEVAEPINKAPGETVEG